jgi:hypothetical protein
MQKIELKGQETLELVAKVRGLNYKSEKMVGRTFTRVLFREFVIASDDQDPVTQMIVDQDLASVTITIEEREVNGVKKMVANIGGYTSLSASRKRQIADKKFDLQIKSLDTAITAEITPAMMEALLKASI